MADDTNAFDDAAIERLRLAAEEVAWLTGRGYPLADVGAFVATHHRLRKEKQIVTGDADTLDACAAWFNLSGPIVQALPGAKVVRLQ
ncbi:MAG: DUF434 domain-containing protein [Labilithrix sp.]|nr:DUF434 domain-containing protein [Labilithrix sp.]MCW5818182.1 DUF434 domain-containing protein [Labilithrix sp.]